MVICAAIMRDGEIVRGQRHSDAIRTAVEELGRKEPIHTREQGFLNSSNAFISREEAYTEARNCYQLKVGQRIKDTKLYSEDIY